jgi:hypothetical protein
LSCKYVTCHIHEVFCPGAWTIVPQIDEHEQK